MSEPFRMTGQELRRRILTTIAWTALSLVIVGWMLFYLMPSITGQVHPFAYAVVIGMLVLCALMQGWLTWVSSVPKRQIEMQRIEREDKIIAEAEEIKRRRSADGAL